MMGAKRNTSRLCANEEIPGNVMLSGRLCKKSQP
jgi:hypothetical protein